MPALVTAAPILIDPAGHARQFSDEVNPMGIFLAGGLLYLVLAATDGTPDLAAEVWSTPDGEAWTQQDQANAPSAATYTGKSCTFNASTGIISILLNDNPNGKLRIASFNTATNLYGALSAESALTNQTFAALYQQSGGALIAPLNNDFGSGSKLAQANLASGSWAGPTQLGSIAGPLVYGCVGDSSDRGHVLYADASFNLQYAQLSAGLSLGTPVEVAAAADWDGQDIDQRIWNGKLVVARTNQNILYVSIGDPLSGPTFTEYTIDTVGGAGTLAYPTLAEDKDGNLVVFVAYTDFSGAPIDELSMWTFDGVSSWGSPVLFYDEVANPPANSVTQVDQFIHTGAAYQFPSGKWLFVTALEVRPASHTFCAGFALVTPSLSITCPVINSGDIGIPYEGQILVSGGTPPYTFETI